MQERHSGIRMRLAGIPLFARLDDAGLSRVTGGATEIEAGPGTTLFDRDDACDGLYILIAGRVKLALPRGPGIEKVIALIGPGESLDESTVLLGAPHLVSAQTLVRSTLLHVSKAAVRACMKRDPEFARQAVMLLSRRVQGLVRDIENAAMLTGTQRVLDFLIAELPAAATQGAATIALPAKKHMIASRLDLTREHFSRILHDLWAEKLLVVKGPTVTIHDVRRLVAYRGASEPA